MMKSSIRNWGRTQRLTASVVSAITLLGLVFVITNRLGDNEYTIRAEFAQASGIYKGDKVQILGVPVGRVTAVETGSSVVTVTMTIPSRYKLPADVHAVQLNPNPVSERVIELTPAYASGDVFGDGGTIPQDRTAAPLEIDDIYTTLGRTARVLGPKGANRNGALSDALKAIAEVAEGNGAQLNAALASLSRAIPAVTSDPQALKALLVSMSQLTTVLAKRSNTIDALYGNITSVTQNLAGQRATIAATLDTLAVALNQVANFIRTNRDTIHATVGNLATTIGAVIKDQQGLINTFKITPLAIQNLNNTIDLDGLCPNGRRGCPAVNVRYNVPANFMDLVHQYCGSTIYPGLVRFGTEVLKGENVNLGNVSCLADFGFFQNRAGPPGAPRHPDLELSRFVK